MPKARDYKHEYARDQASPRDIANRSARNKAAREENCRPGQEVDHKQPLSKNGSNAKSNRRCISRHANRVKGAK